MDVKDKLLKIELPGHAFYKEEMTGRTLTELEVKKLAALTHGDNIKGIVQLLNDAVSNDLFELYTDDFWYLMWWLRVQTFPSYPIVVPWTCKCGAENKSDLTADKLKYIDIPEEFNPLHAQVRLSNGELISIRPQKVKDEFDVDAYLKQRMIKDPDRSIKGVLLDLACLGEGKTIDDLYKSYKAGNFSTEDFFTIQGFKTLYTWGVNKIADFSCYKCKEGVSVEYEVTLTNFFPDILHREYLKQRILFNVPSTPTEEPVRDDGLQRV